MAAGVIARLVELGDLDELVRLVDRLCGAANWDGILELRDRCRAALHRGKQLWPAAAHAEYRLALEAPARWAAVVLEPGAGRFALGPLTEVAASTHSWAELAPHVPAGPMSAMVAHERVVRGEDLQGDARVDRQVLELPLVLQPWEPNYPVAEYGAHEAMFPSPSLPRLLPVRLAGGARRAEETEGSQALAELAAVWTAESNGRAEAVAVHGRAEAAVAATGAPSARLGEMPPADALAHMAWAGASGGAHGRRRGMAAGRFGAWWTVASLAGIAQRWPVTPDEVGDAACTLRWYAWDAGDPLTGWSLHLAVEDPDEGLAWAVTAVDSA